MKNLMKVKDDGGKEIIIEVGLAVIGVALLIVFRTQIANLVNSIVTRATNEINSLFDTSAMPGA